jgi:hypothetical protein
MSQQADTRYSSNHKGECCLSEDEELLDDEREEFAVEDYAIPRLASGNIASFEDDSDSSMTPASFPEISEHAYRDNKERQDDEEQLNLQDSVGSLNEAFEKLDKCMERTAQSRAMLREKMDSPSLSTTRQRRLESLQGAQIEKWKYFVLQHLEPKLKEEGNK